MHMDSRLRKSFMNPDNTMVKFGVPLFGSDCLLSAWTTANEPGMWQIIGTSVVLTTWEELDSWVQCWPRSVGAWRWYSVSDSFLNRSSVRALEVDAQLEFSIFISPSCSSRLIDFYAFLIFKASTGDIIRFCCCRDHGHYWYLLVDCLSVSWDLCHVLTGLLWAVESSIVFVLEDELI